MHARQAISHLARRADRAERTARRTERTTVPLTAPLLAGGRPDPVVPFANRFNELLNAGGIATQNEVIKRIMKEFGFSRGTAYERLKKAREQNLVPPLIPKPRELTNQMQRIDPKRDDERRSA